MNITTKGRVLFFLLKPTTIILIYTCVSLLIAFLKYSLGAPNSHINNFIIYKSSFAHFYKELHLYTYYPEEYFDLFLYGPLFSFLIAPFAFMPTLMSVCIWNVLNGLLILCAVYQLPGFSNRKKGIILWIVLNSCITSFSNVQVHGIILALIILSYAKIQRGQDVWGTFFIVLGTLLKLYGIVGLVFFLFSKNKLKFVLCGVFWSVFLFFLPICLSSFNYLLQCYQDWYGTLVYKNTINMSIENRCTDMSVMGIVRRILNDSTISGLYFIIPAMFTFSLLLLRFKYFQKVKFQLRVLSSVLLMLVLTNTNSEASTLLIGFMGVAIWYLISSKLPIDHFLFVLAIVFSSFGPTDLMPSFLKDGYLRKYSLMSLPLLLVWLKINFEILFNYKCLDDSPNLLANDKRNRC